MLFRPLGTPLEPKGPRPGHAMGPHGTAASLAARPDEGFRAMPEFEEPHPQQLADALAALLKPLKLTNGIRFKEQSTPVERVDFFHRQELCWIRITEPPPPPPEPPVPNSVRCSAALGGGPSVAYHDLTG
eukprot:Skav207082  [mRNA]  locus=scaffold1909:579246:582595:+ [translate_table: standard]